MSGGTKNPLVHYATVVANFAIRERTGEVMLAVKVCTPEDNNLHIFRRESWNWTFGPLGRISSARCECD